VGLLRFQAKNPQYDLDFTDYSVKTPFKVKWKTNCAVRIEQASAVVVMIGEETHQREAVSWEIRTARKLGKPIIGVRIKRGVKPPAELQRQGGKLISWKIGKIQEELRESVAA
jgi:hypothetical protein